jgi:hypothetical protein
MSTRVIYAFDVGGSGNFGWARRDPLDPDNMVGSGDITQLVDYLIRDARQGKSIALGVEAPCFIPVPWDKSNLNERRQGEDRYPWSAQAGAIAAIIGVHQTAWVLRELHGGFGGTHQFTTDWSLWPGSNRPILLLWEAFVCNSAKAKPRDDVQDAATAVHEFAQHEDELAEINAVTCFPRICFTHAAALWSTTRCWLSAQMKFGKGHLVRLDCVCVFGAIGGGGGRPARSSATIIRLGNEWIDLRMLIS